MTNNTMNRLIVAACGAIILVIWLILPVISFFPVPLLIDGVLLAWRVNQIVGFLLMMVIIMMIILPFFCKKEICIGIGALNAVLCLLTLILGKTIIMTGNLRWVFALGSGLIQQIASWFGQSISASNVNEAISFLCDNLLAGGIGLWISLILSIVYSVLSGFLDFESVSRSNITGGNTGARKTNTAPSSASTTNRYSHRT